MGRNLSAKQPAKNIAAQPPTKMHTLSSGITRVEKLNPIPLNRKLVDPDGNVVTMSLATGFTIRNANNDYGASKLREKMAKGFIPYDECPVAKGYVTIEKGDKACTGSDGRGKFSKDACCEHIEKIVNARREVARKREAKSKERFATQTERTIELLVAQTKALSAAEPADPTGGKKGGLFNG
jgi:hypothetical protein